MFESMMPLQGTPLSGIGSGLSDMLGPDEAGSAIAISRAEMTGGDWRVDMGGKQTSIILIVAVVAAIYLFSR